MFKKILAEIYACKLFIYLKYNIQDVSKFFCKTFDHCEPGFLQLGYWCVSCVLALRKHDVAFLVTVRPTQKIGMKFSLQEPFVPQVGLVSVRGCEIEGMLDEEGKVIEEGRWMPNQLHLVKEI